MSQAGGSDQYRRPQDQCAKLLQGRKGEKASVAGEERVVGKIAGEAEREAMVSKERVKA